MPKYNKKNIGLLFVIALVPLIGFADTTIRGILNTVQGILEFTIPILMVLATILFIWGLVWYLTSTGKEDKQKEARNLMIWGVIILFAMVAVWGLVAVLGKTFSIDSRGIPDGPSLR